MPLGTAVVAIDLICVLAPLGLDILASISYVHALHMLLVPDLAF